MIPPAGRVSRRRGFWIGAAALSLVSAGVIHGQYLERLLTVGRGPVAMALDSLRQRLFVVCQNSNTMAVVSTESLRLSAVVNLGSKPTDVLVVPSRARVYVVCAPGSGNGSVRVYDASDLSLVSAVGVGKSPMKLVYDSIDNRVACLNRLSPSVSIIRCDSSRVVRNVTLAQTPEDIVWNPTANRLYVVSGAYMQSGRITVINPQTAQTTKTISSGEDGWRVACDPVRNRVYASFRGSRTLAVVDAGRDSIVRILPTQSEVWAMLYLGDDKLYVGNYWTSTVSVLYGSDSSFARTFRVAGGPVAFQLNPLTGKVYAASYLESRVSVIDSRADELWDSIGIGAGPSDIEVCLATNRVFVCNSWDSTVAVIRDELTGTAEGDAHQLGYQPEPATIVRSIRDLPATDGRRMLFDVHGRHRAEFAQDGQLSPGVYFIKSSGRVRRLIVVRH